MDGSEEVKITVTIYFKKSWTALADSLFPLLYFSAPERLVGDYLSFAGCHDEYHRFDNLNNQSLFLTALEAGKSEIQEGTQ